MQPTREVGRPRTFADEEVFQVTTRLLTERGGRGLTLAAVGRELGCTPQALIRRFGSKQGLLRAYLIWSEERITAHFQAVRRAYPSPLVALRARFLLPVEARLEELPDAAGTAPGQPRHANVLAFFVEAGNDPELRALLAHRRQVYETEIASFLTEARAAGELGDCDVAEVARTLFQTLTGATTLWLIERQGPVVDHLAGAVDAVLAPYRVHRS